MLRLEADILFIATRTTTDSDVAELVRPRHECLESASIAHIRGILMDRGVTVTVEYED